MARAQWKQIIPAAILASSIAVCSGATGGAEDRAQLIPHFVEGQTLRYQFELRTETTSHSTGPIADPEAAGELTLSVSSVVRLNVLRVEGEGTPRTSTIRMRATYEKTTVEAHGDAFDPQQERLKEQYRKLGGHSIEFTLRPGGEVTDITGFENILPNEAAAGAVKEWLEGIAQGSSLPPEGIAIGQKWFSERPVQAAPLEGLAWKTESTYERNEACGNTGSSSAQAGRPTASDEDCAIILTRFEIDEKRIPSDPTPPAYRRSSLRTSGKWTGSGESLTAISLRSGLVTSVTQTGIEDLDITIASATANTSMRYSGTIKTKSQITLLGAAPSDSH